MQYYLISQRKRAQLCYVFWCLCAYVYVDAFCSGCQGGIQPDIGPDTGAEVGVIKVSDCLYFLVSFEDSSQLCANDIVFCLSPSAKWPQSTVSSFMFTSNLSCLCFSFETILKLIKLTLLQRARCAVVWIGECPLISSMAWHVQYMLTDPCRSIVSKLIAFQLLSSRELWEIEDCTIAVKNQSQTHNTVWIHGIGINNIDSFLTTFPLFHSTALESFLSSDMTDSICTFSIQHYACLPQVALTLSQ